jgi:pimeloyl-ACP methyl ester carboxylesterase
MNRLRTNKLQGAKSVVGLVCLTTALLSFSCYLVNRSTQGVASENIQVAVSTSWPGNDGMVSSSELASTEESTIARLTEAYGKLPLQFEANEGQTDSSVKFISRGSGSDLYLASDGAVLSLGVTRGQVDTATRRSEIPNQRSRIKNQKSAALQMKLAGANRRPQISAIDELPGKTNYLIGNDPAEWRTNISTYARVRYRDIYPGVDLTYYGNQRQLEYDFVVSPGANPGDVRLVFTGSKGINIDPASGDLVLRTSGGEVRQRKPLIYQEVDGVRHQIAGRYTLLDAKARTRNPRSANRDRQVGFEVSAYDASKPLVIDPVLVYSTYLGGNRADECSAIAVDAAGNAYVTGRTQSTDFPGANSPSRGLQDTFVTKINADGSALVYSTYLGGSKDEYGLDIAIDGAGNAFVTGRTWSSDFPAVNAFDSSFVGSTSGDGDVFVTRLNPAGTSIVYSTFLSGTYGARGYGIATDGAGNAYVTGTTSIKFPVTTGAFESTNYNSGFMAKLNTNGSGASSLLYSTFLAHKGSTEGRAIAADAIGNVYVTGTLYSNATSFATPGAFQTTFGGGSSDAFVEQFNTNLSGEASRSYATYLGGSGADFGGATGANDSGKAIAIDPSGNAYITGHTASTNFPVFPVGNAYQGANGGQHDAFLTKLDAAGSSLIYSTYLGGSGDDFGRSVAVNASGNAYVTGVADRNFPTLSPLPAPNGACCPFGFVTKFTPSGTSLVYSTTLSGVSYGSFGIAVDGAGNAFATGSTNAGIVTTSSSFQTSPGLGGTVGWLTVIADAKRVVIKGTPSPSPFPEETPLPETSPTPANNGLPAGAGVITVTKARIGCLDIQTGGNLTNIVATACNNRGSCSYKAPTPNEYSKAGVQAQTRLFCTQAMEITYHCGSNGDQTITVPGDAWNQPPAQLTCNGGMVATNRQDVTPPPQGSSSEPSCTAPTLGQPDYYIAPRDMLDWTPTSSIIDYTTPEYLTSGFHPPQPPTMGMWNSSPASNIIGAPGSTLGANEGRLRAELRAVAQKKDPVYSLCQAAQKFTRNGAATANTPTDQDFGNALADLSVTGKAAFARFVQLHPDEASLGGDPGCSGATASSMTKALTRAYLVANALAGLHDSPERKTLGWIAVSGEDDQPDRPVNVPSTSFPQFHISVDVPRFNIAVNTRYMIAHARNAPTFPRPATPLVNGGPGYQVPADRLPALAADAQVILFIHGMDSRLEEAADLTKALHGLGGKNWTVISLDLPTSGYADNIDHRQISPISAVQCHNTPLVDYLEDFIVAFVDKLDSQLNGQLKPKIKAVVGGSLGGNMAMRLGRRPNTPWVTNVVPWSPAAIWPSFVAQRNAVASGCDTGWDALHDKAVNQSLSWSGWSETPSRRRDLFYGGFDWSPVYGLGGPPQAQCWFSDKFQCKKTDILAARLDRQETYDANFRAWHWRLGAEQLVFSQQQYAPGTNTPLYLLNTKRMLLFAGYEDTCGNLGDHTRLVASKMVNTPGYARFLKNTGHSLDTEHPEWIAREIVDFLR